MPLKTQIPNPIKIDNTFQVMITKENTNACYLIENATLVNEGKLFIASVLIQDGIIDKIEPSIRRTDEMIVIDARGRYLLPGIIDTHVHFRDPGLTDKGDFATESRAAVAGGITSVVDMPNTYPQTVSKTLLDEKKQLASQKSLVNYGFMLGATNTNISDLLQIDTHEYAAIKLFLGSSTGNMLVNDPSMLELLFRDSKKLIVAHCEDENRIKQNTIRYKAQYGNDAPPSIHPKIRDEESCFIATNAAVALAKKYNTRFHVAHISTAKELSLLPEVSIQNKHITAEVTPNHLWFCDADYERLGNLIRCNPAIKSSADRKALRDALKNGIIDTIATDHAPHLLSEKKRPYFESASGMPSIQHALPTLLELWKQGEISLETIVEKMSHNPAILFGIKNRGFIREGYAADLVLINSDMETTVKNESLYYKCGWSPLDGTVFHSCIDKTFVNGTLIYNEGNIINESRGIELEFNK